MMGFLRDLLRRYLKRKGYGVRVTVNGEEPMWLIPGDSAEITWSVKLELDGEYVRLYALGEYAGTIDPEKGWSSTHKVKVSYRQRW